MGETLSGRPELAQIVAELVARPGVSGWVHGMVRQGRRGSDPAAERLPVMTQSPVFLTGAIGSNAGDGGVRRPGSGAARSPGS
jgi:hypothetical protein